MMKSKIILFGSIGLMAVGTAFHLSAKKDGKCPLGRMLHPTHTQAQAKTTQVQP